MINAVAYAVSRKGNLLLDKVIARTNAEAKLATPSRSSTLVRRFGVVQEGDLLSLGPQALLKADVAAFPTDDAPRLRFHIENSDLVRVYWEFIPALTTARWRQLERDQEIFLQLWDGETLRKERRLYPGNDMSALELYLGLPKEVLLTKSRMLKRRSLPSFLKGSLRGVVRQVSFDSRSAK